MNLRYRYRVKRKFVDQWPTETEVRRLAKRWKKEYGEAADFNPFSLDEEKE